MTIAAEGGASIEQMKKLGGWSSTSVLEGYIRNTDRMKNLNADYFETNTFDVNQNDSSSSNITINANQASNFVVNINNSK